MAEFHRAVETGSPRSSAQLAYAYAVTGRRAEALSILGRLVEHDGGHGAPPFHVAMAYAGLELRDEALQWLERAADELDPWVTALNIEPAFEALRTDARFTQLVRRIGLEPAARPA
jgi:tetratricopeptide (TPR) repeat protein